MQRQREHDYDYINNAIQRLRLYQTTGNTELLVDSANISMLAYLFDSHPLKHFRSTDDAAHHCGVK